jgi:hypothetical protein
MNILTFRLNIRNISISVDKGRIMLNPTTILFNFIKETENQLAVCSIVSVFERSQILNESKHSPELL